MLVERNPDSRWYMPEREMVASHQFYDEYCSGLAYITSTAVISKEWEYLRTHKVHFNRIDDFFVTGKLAAEAKVGHVSEPSIKEWEYLRTHKVHFNRIDDFFVTGKLAAEAEVGHVSEPSMFNLFEVNLKESLNGNGTFFLLHQQNTRELLWKKMLTKWTNRLNS
uniref:Hexosyltransferase n=1 Tax=Panagrolaimus sp. ES5 TaxID=591445 RepID=A0AC34GN95_9BILA